MQSRVKCIRALLVHWTCWNWKKKGQAKCAGVLAWLEVRAGRCEIFLIAPRLGEGLGWGWGSCAKPPKSSAFSYTSWISAAGSWVKSSGWHAWKSAHVGQPAQEEGLYFAKFCVSKINKFQQGAQYSIQTLGFVSQFCWESHNYLDSQSGEGLFSLSYLGLSLYIWDYFSFYKFVFFTYRDFVTTWCRNLQVLNGVWHVKNKCCESPFYS